MSPTCDFCGEPLQYDETPDGWEVWYCPGNCESEALEDALEEMYWDNDDTYDEDALRSRDPYPDLDI